MVRILGIGFLPGQTIDRVCAAAHKTEDVIEGAILEHQYDDVLYRLRHETSVFGGCFRRAIRCRLLEEFNE